MNWSTTAQNAWYVVTAHRALCQKNDKHSKALADRCEQTLIDGLLSDYPLPEGADITDKPDANQITLTAERLATVPEAWVPMVVIEHLITQHHVRFNRKLGAWQRFQRRYLMDF
jgi:hypothetical protein